MASSHAGSCADSESGSGSKNFAPAWQQLGTFNGTLYALVFKAANKSVLWYNVPAFKTAGAKPPKTWAQLLSTAKLLKSSGSAKADGKSS